MKYSKEDLQEYARTALAAKDAGDERYFMLVTALSFVCQLDPFGVELRIKLLASGADPDPL